MTWLDDLTFETVIVHTTGGGPSFKGLKAAVYDDCLVLRDVMILEPESSTVLDGDFVLMREQILGLQVISP